MEKKKILVIVGRLLPPAVSTTGMAAVYNILRVVAREESLELHVLTTRSSWSCSGVESWAKSQKEKYGLTFHFVRGDYLGLQTSLNLILTRIFLLLKAVRLGRRHKFDLLHDHSSLPLLVGITGVLGKICGCKAAHTLCTVNETFLGSPRLAFGLSRVSKIICVSKQIREDLLRAKGCPDKIVYLPLGVDSEKFRPAASSPNSQTVLFLGLLEERKGPFVLAKAVKEVIHTHPQSIFTFAFYGKEGPNPHHYSNKRKLQRMFSGLGDNVRLLEGQLDVPQLMSAVGIFVLPSLSLHGTLGQPLTLLEAMSAGKPCVVSDVCRGDGLVEDDVNCLLFQSGDVDDLANKIHLLLDDKVLREKLARNARQKIVDQFDIHKTAKDLSDLYYETY